MLRLLPLDRNELVALIDDPDRFADTHQVELGVARDALVAVAAQSLEFRDATDIPMPWGAYLAVDEQSGQAVGTCSYKGPPDADGAVEIAYYTFAPFEGRGYATAMAAELIRRARVEGDVTTVVAHTLAEENASVRILRGQGLAHVGELVDPEDGPIWRWELGTP